MNINDLPRPDDDSCQSCGQQFGLGLGMVSRSIKPGICIPCATEATRDTVFDIEPRRHITEDRREA